MKNELTLDILDEAIKDLPRKEMPVMHINPIDYGEMTGSLRALGIETVWSSDSCIVPDEGVPKGYCIFKDR